MIPFANAGTEVQRVWLPQGSASSAGYSQEAKPRGHQKPRGLTQLLSNLSKDARGGPSVGGPSPGRVLIARIWYQPSRS